MSAEWVGGVTRARGLLSRCLGAQTVGQLAASASLGDALRQLAATPYRRALTADATVAEAQRAVSVTLLWHLRVLAGWLPRSGANAVRVLAAGFEIANTEDRLRALEGARTPQPYRLGALATAWNRLARAGTPAEVRSVLAASAWGDPGGEGLAATGTAMRVAAAVRAADTVPPAHRWAAGRAALLAARGRFVTGRPLAGQAARHAARLLGHRAVETVSFEDFRRRLVPAARWAVDGVESPDELWRAEARWWKALDRDGRELLRGARYGLEPVVGAVAVLSADAWRVRAALELAERGGGSLEVLGALV
ncbi:V-type ATPase subunit [Kitasatospora sp. HPMI-4]|uniref:V-type ATPase subunit n=1 Tax=Kitasatospora sp. HPMI-4 TaxID=3448443 RepID=UPI003F1B6CEA